MPVFNIAANTKDYSGVNPFYQGEAIRAGLREGELQNDLLQKEVDSFDERLALDERRVGVYEESVELQKQREERFREEYEDYRKTEEGQKFDRVMSSSIAAYENAIAEKKTEAEAREFSYEVMLGEWDRLTEGGRDEAIKSLEENNITPESFDPAMIKSALGIVPERQEQPDWIGIMKDFTGESVRAFAQTGDPTQLVPVGKTGSAPKTKPIPTPTRAEADIVDEVVGNIVDGDKYDDYGFDNQSEDNMKRWLADTTERIQRLHAERNRALGYAEAAEMAAIEMEKFIKGPSDPGFFSDDDYQFVYPEAQIGDIIMGDDGNQWKVTGYNEKGGPRGEIVGD